MSFIVAQKLCTIVAKISIGSCGVVPVQMMFAFLKCKAIECAISTPLKLAKCSVPLKLNNFSGDIQDDQTMPIINKFTTAFKVKIALL